MWCAASGAVGTLCYQHPQASGPFKACFEESCGEGEGKERERVQGTHQGGGNLIICDGCWIG